MPALRAVASRAAIVVVCAVALGACTKTLDTAKLESSLKSDIAKKANVVVKSVSCPSDVKPVKGDTFVCTVVTGDGKTHHATVTQTDDQGHVSYQVTD